MDVCLFVLISDLWLFMRSLSFLPLSPTYCFFTFVASNKINTVSTVTVHVSSNGMYVTVNRTEKGVTWCYYFACTTPRCSTGCN